ncbi:serine/threonine-protein kinase [Tundrisphaera sp. TA3]|uniref:serine/threonine-protein kinase n=1 Tax=Tundrisphaera sp. TA3 TaxID=3435775 RepID=UPI003EB8786E
MTTVPDDPDQDEVPPTQAVAGDLPSWAALESTYEDPFRTGGPGATTGPTSADASRIPVVEGQTLFGKYRVVRRLGNGAMGEVWLVRHEKLKREHALKVIVPHLASSREALARFRREFEVMASFHHEHAVTIHDAGLDEDGGYIDMEYVQGRTVHDLLASARADARRDPSAPLLPLATIRLLLGQLCDVLAVAHEAGIVHRDLKPSNLMLTRRGPSGSDFLKVLDFGIAKIRNDPDNKLNDSSITGGFIGTPSYCSPEQVLTQPVDGRSDLYSVGVLLYEMIGGRLPFSGPPLQVMLHHAQRVPPSFAEINPGLSVAPGVEAVIRRLLSKDPAQRPATARELFRDFCEAASEAPVAIGAGVPMESTSSFLIQPPAPSGEAITATIPGFFEAATEPSAASRSDPGRASSGVRTTPEGPTVPLPLCGTDLIDPPAPARTRAPWSRGLVDVLLVLASAATMLVAMILAGQAHARLLSSGLLGQWFRIAAVMITMGFIVIMGVSLHEQSVMRAPRFFLMGHSLGRVVSVACIAANLCLIAESIYCLVI